MEKDDVIQRMAPPLILNQPFVPRSTTFPDDDDEYESAYSHPGTPIMTPHTDYADDDLPPPTYEEAQRAVALEYLPVATDALEVHRLSITDEPAPPAPADIAPVVADSTNISNSPQYTVFEKTQAHPEGQNPPFNSLDWAPPQQPRSRSWGQWARDTERWWADWGENVEKRSLELGARCEEVGFALGKWAETWGEQVARRANGDMPRTFPQGFPHSFPQNGGYYYPNYYNNANGPANNNDGIVSRGCRNGPFLANVIEQHREMARLRHEAWNGRRGGFYPHHRGRHHHHRWNGEPGRAWADHRDIVEIPVHDASDSESEDEEIPDPQVAFLEKLRDINARAESLQTEGKKPQWQIDHERDKAIEKAQKDKEKAELKVQRKLETRERKRTLRQVKQEFKAAHKGRKKELHQRKKERKQEWKQACHQRQACTAAQRE